MKKKSIEENDNCYEYTHWNLLFDGIDGIQTVWNTQLAYFLVFCHSLCLRLAIKMCTSGGCWKEDSWHRYYQKLQIKSINHCTNENYIYNINVNNWRVSLSLAFYFTGVIGPIKEFFKCNFMFVGGLVCVHVLIVLGYSKSRK